MSEATRHGSAAAILFVLVCLLAGPAPAAASSQDLELLGTMPGAAEVVEEAPAVARVVFDRPVEPGPRGVTVVDADGQRVDEGDAGPGESPLVVEASLPAELAPGVYTASWQVRTGDGELHEGAWRFRVGDGPPPEGPGSDEPGDRLPLILAGVFVIALASVGLWLARSRMN